MTSTHVHSHPHDHHRNGELQARVHRLIQLAQDRGIVTFDEIDARLSRFLQSTSSLNGARIVARAWADEAFARRLANDATAAVQELGCTVGHGRHLKALFNTATIHNVVVCTLCSCYPIAIMGPPPAWYKSEAYRSRVVRDPRSVLQEFGLALPEAVEVHVWDSTADLRYLVVPQRPAATEGLDEAALAALVSVDCLIGTSVP